LENGKEFVETPGIYHTIVRKQLNSVDKTPKYSTSQEKAKLWRNFNKNSFSDVSYDGFDHSSTNWETNAYL